MTDPAVAALLAPIAPDRPAGRDLRDDDTYRRIADARRDEGAALPQGVWVRDVKQADWALVERLCRTALAERSKDLRIACWLSEAWVHRRGFAGLAQALALLDGLCTDYWDGLYPPLDGDDPGARVMALDWLNTRLPGALRQVPVATDGERSYDWADHGAALRLEAVRSRDAAAAQKAEGAGAVTLAAIEACRERTDPAMLREIADDLAAALATLAALDATLDRRCGREAPSLGRIREVAADIADYTAAALAARQTILPPDPPPPPPLAMPVAARSAAPTAPAGPMSRAAAYRQLAAVAAALHAADPHSPVPAVLDRLLAWEALSLAEIDSALDDEGSGVSMLLQVLGMIAREE